MKNPIITIKDYIDYYRMCVAAWIYPESYENSVKYKQILNDLRDMEEYVGKNIPEVAHSANWILGKNWEHTMNDADIPLDSNLQLTLFPSYVKYKSLVHFKDVLENDYKRKLKN